MNIKDLNVESYGKNRDNNYGVNSLMVELEDITLYYSYNTIIGLHSYKLGLKIVSSNVWSHTTGKHINTLKGRGFKEIKNKEFKEIINKIGIESFTDLTKNSI